MRYLAGAAYLDELSVSIAGPALLELPPEPAPQLRLIAAEDIEGLLGEWATHLRGRNCKPNSIRAMLGEVRRAARECGWVGSSDLTYRAVIGWLDAHADWSPTTRDRNLSIFRSLTKWLEACEVLPSDPLRRAVRAGGVGGPGARAATTDEARRLIRAAWEREQTDARTQRGGCRSLYYLTLFLAGCRKAEPGGWLWSDLLLDEDSPVILWRPETHKAGRRDEVAIAPELAERLRLWREQSDITGKVFPTGVHKATIERDRERAGIPKHDARGRAFSAHSARKWHSTVLTSAGVAPRLVDKLMRHSGGTEARYYDPSPAEWSGALALLPKLWPSEGGHDA